MFSIIMKSTKAFLEYNLIIKVISQSMKLIIPLILDQQKTKTVVLLEVDLGQVQVI